MDRRSLLVAIGALSSGCLTRVPGGPDFPYIDEETVTPGETPVETPAGTPTPGGDAGTETPGETPTETATATPEPFTRAVRQAQDAIAAAVETYADGSELTNVDASTAFDDRSTAVIDHLIDARQATERARDLVSTDAELATVDDLFAVYRTVRRSVDTQLALRRGYVAAENARDALELGEAPAARSAVVQIDSRQSIAMRSFEDVALSTNRASLDVTAALSAEQFDDKVAQFRAEIDALGGLETPLTDLVDGVQYLTEAQNLERDGNPQSAESAASRALVAFRQARSDLQAYRSRLGNWTRPFRRLADDFETVLERKMAEANRILD